jgi:hypothetical protein
MIILKSAAYYALTNEELEEILSCNNEPVLKAYVVGLFLAACSLWKFVMPVEAKAIFQNDFFHPATVNPKLQAHLGLSLKNIIFNNYVGFILEYVIFNIFNIFCLFSWVDKGARATSTAALHLSLRPRQKRLPKEELKGL